MIRSFFITLLSCLLVFSISSSVQARGSVNAGDKIPHDLSLKDHTGKMQSFKNLSGKKGMVLAFVRSVEWCSYCQKQVIELNKNKKKFKDLGYSVVTVSYDQIEHMKKFVAKNKPSITLLSDPASESIRAFGILNEASAKGTMSYGIPHPGVYVVDKNKKVQAKFFEKGYQNRPEVSSILAKIKKINAPKIPPMTVETMGTDPIAPEELYIQTPEKIMDPIVLPEEVPQAPAKEAIIPNATNQKEFFEMPQEIPVKEPMKAPVVPQAQEEVEEVIEEIQEVEIPATPLVPEAPEALVQPEAAVEEFVTPVKETPATSHPAM